MDVAWVTEGGGAGTGRAVTSDTDISAWEKKNAPDVANDGVTMRWDAVVGGVIAWDEKENVVGARTDIFTTAGTGSLSTMAAACAREKPRLCWRPVLPTRRI